MICSRDFYNQSPFNRDTKEQLWMSIVNDSHDSICGCSHGFAHLLSIIFPPEHTDRKLTVEQILRRDYKEKCRSGGLAGDAFGPPETTTGPVSEKEPEERDPDDADIDELLAAATAAEESER